MERVARHNRLPIAVQKSPCEKVWIDLAVAAEEMRGAGAETPAPGAWGSAVHCGWFGVKGSSRESCRRGAQMAWGLVKQAARTHR
jgi:hypothetical protein